MAKNLILGLIFARFGPNLVPSFFFFLQVLPQLDVIHCCKLSLYAISRKTKEPNLRKWQKTQFWAQFSPSWPKFGPPFLFIFFQTSGSVSHQIPWSAIIMYSMRKPNDPMLRKLIYESTDGKMDRRMRVILQDTTTNVERPKMKLGFKVCFVKILMFS